MKNSDYMRNIHRCHILSGNMLLEVLISLALLAMMGVSLLTLLSSQYLKKSDFENHLLALDYAKEGLQAARAIRDGSWSAMIPGSHGVTLNNGLWSFQGTEDDSNPPFKRTITVADVSNTGIVTYQPALGFNGIDTFDYRICDIDRNCDTAKVTVNVGTVTNHAPVANADASNTPKNTSININVPANDTDADGNLKTNSVTVTTNPSHGTITGINSTGVITYRPTTNYAGADSFIYQICDTAGSCSKANVMIVVVDSAKITLVAHEIVCQHETDMPNWGTGGQDITANTASDYIKQKGGKCWFDSNWGFEWGPSGVSVDGAWIGPAPAGKGWNSFDTLTSASGPASAVISTAQLQGQGQLWVRQMLKVNYLPYTSPPKGLTEDNVTSEVYCSNDVLNYDNYDRIGSPAVNRTYYCVGFNAPTVAIETPIAGNDVATTTADTPIDIDLPTNDTSQGSVLDLNNVTVIIPPSHGTAEFISATQKSVASTVDWVDSRGTPRSISLTSEFTNWRNAQTPQAWGDWAHPITGGGVDLSGYGSDLTSVTVDGNRAYVTIGTPIVNKPDFVVIDVQDADHPHALGGVYTGAGLMDVAISGNMAYAVTRSQNDKLQVIDVSNPAIPVLRSALNVTTAVQYPQRIKVSGNYAYVTSKYDNLGEFAVFDVSNHDSPTLKGKLKLSADVNGLAISGNRAYLATSKDSGEIMVINISSPTNPVSVGTLDIPGNGDAKDVYFDTARHLAFVARNAEGAAANPEIAVLDIHTIDAPVIVGLMQSNSGYLRALSSDGMAFASSLNAVSEFQSFDVKRIAYPASLGTANYANNILSMALSNNVVYLGLAGPAAMQLITAR